MHRPLARRGSVDIERVDADAGDPCPHQRLRRLGGEVWVALEVAVGAEVLRVVGADEHRVPGQPSELVVGQRDRLAVAAVEQHGR